ncbi:ribosomal protein subunit L51-b [Schizosaccharomyces japonicus yFS275]|uniref:Ribosomal protein subunit L51-b n=1 Tax=Schizosaccharomyces japonicus (strain yFS275 / FY16936) TaxID=402676 RepID=B6JXG6_SCHJY|nr:ribosomal protein subunit L51-b [Schizosaccharomyces japonicus yFS275]EEB05110.1 ribosomal protein subunit L51-b [Schizosaccharomyces japonicus yFS275]
MNFAFLLRKSRVCAVPSRIQSTPAMQKNAPLRIAVMSKQNLKRRGDWGVKRNLPAINNRHISIKLLDSADNLCWFESSDRFVRTLKRLNGIQLPLSTSHNHETSEGTLLERLASFVHYNRSPVHERFPRAAGITYSRLLLLSAKPTKRKKFNSAIYLSNPVGVVNLPSSRRSLRHSGINPLLRKWSTRESTYFGLAGVVAFITHPSPAAISQTVQLQSWSVTKEKNISFEPVLAVKEP